MQQCDASLRGTFFKAFKAIYKYGCESYTGVCIWIEFCLSSNILGPKLHCKILIDVVTGQWPNCRYP